METKKVTVTLTTFTLISYLLCVGLGLLLPDNFGMHQLLEMILPGFNWISWESFLVGLVGSVLWGAYIGFGYSFIYNFVNRQRSL